MSEEIRTTARAELLAQIKEQAVSVSPASSGLRVGWWLPVDALADKLTEPQ